MEYQVVTGRAILRLAAIVCLAINPDWLLAQDTQEKSALKIETYMSHSTVNKLSAIRKAAI
jgi:hypothetical protein